MLTPWLEAPYQAEMHQIGLNIEKIHLYTSIFLLTDSPTYKKYDDD